MRTETWYSRDASGNVMAVYNVSYDSIGSDMYQYTFINERPIYGSSRVGQYVTADTVKTVIFSTDTTENSVSLTDTGVYSRTLDKRRYELQDHLGNVRMVVSDIKLSTMVGGVPQDFYPETLSWNNYYAFGMLQPQRNGNPGDYRYGFNGMEKDDEVKGSGNSYTTLYRQYDSRIGRWMSLDPLETEYPSWSPYNFIQGNPVSLIDNDGDEPSGPPVRRSVPRYASPNPNYRGVRESYIRTTSYRRPSRPPRKRGFVPPNYINTADAPASGNPQSTTDFNPPGQLLAPTIHFFDKIFKPTNLQVQKQQRLTKFYQLDGGVKTELKPIRFNLSGTDAIIVEKLQEEYLSAYKSTLRSQLIKNIALKLKKDEGEVTTNELSNYRFDATILFVSQKATIELIGPSPFEQIQYYFDNAVRTGKLVEDTKTNELDEIQPF